MKAFYQSLLLAISALALAGVAYAQVPSTNDTSAGSNTGMGSGALGGPSPAHLTGSENTAAGVDALSFNTSGSENTAAGAYVLEDNTTGSGNTAIGTGALQDNTTGSDNTACGEYALEDNNADGNTAIGTGALEDNLSGTGNTASGEYALEDNSSGNNNTAAGYNALLFNETGDKNTASGYQALYSNTTASFNTAYGFASLFTTNTGEQNSALGVYALYSNTTGSSNIAEGYRAGYNLTTGSNNIDIGNVGIAAESGVIRVGTSGKQTETFIAGIHNSMVTGSAVYVTSEGQLGVLASSERFKTDIAPMGSDTVNLAQLRPVSFRLKSDATSTRQYGLVAEEVAKVYPELVIRDSSGRIQGVRYDELAPMLLNEVQKQQGKNAAQDSKIRDLEQQVAEMRAALLKLQAKDERVAQR
jgi:hypothetical protein